MNIAVIKSFIDAGADVNAKDSNGNFPLHTAAKKNNTQGLDKKGSDKKNNPERVRIAKMPIMTLLVNAKAKIDERDGDGNPPLDYVDNSDFKRDLTILAHKKAGKTHEGAVAAYDKEYGVTQAPHVAQASAPASGDSPSSLADQITKFIITGVVTQGRGKPGSKGEFITQMAGAIIASEETTDASDKAQTAARTAARKTAEIIYDELDRMTKLTSLDDKTFMQSVNDLARAAKAFFTDLIFGEDKAATRSTVQEALRGNTTTPEPTPASASQSDVVQIVGGGSGGSESTRPLLAESKVNLHAQLKTTMYELKSREVATNRMSESKRTSSSPESSRTSASDDTQAAQGNSSDAPSSVLKVADSAVTGALSEQSSEHQVS